MNEHGFSVNLAKGNYTKYKCNKCKRITIIVGMVMSAHDQSADKSYGIEEFERYYCMYCYRDFFDANVGQLTVIDDVPPCGTDEVNFESKKDSCT